MTVDHKVINLGSIPVSLKANAVQNQNIRIVGKESLEVEGHLLFGGTARLRKFVIGLKRV